MKRSHTMSSMCVLSVQNWVVIRETSLHFGFGRGHAFCTFFFHSFAVPPSLFIPHTYKHTHSHRLSSFALVFRSLTFPLCTVSHIGAHSRNNTTTTTTNISKREKKATRQITSHTYTFTYSRRACVCWSHAVFVVCISCPYHYVCACACMCICLHMSLHIHIFVCVYLYYDIHMCVRLALEWQHLIHVVMIGILQYIYILYVYVYICNI